MELKAMKEIALKIMENAEDVYDKDAVLAEMFSQGIPFAKLQPVYREVGQENDLIVDVATAKEQIMESVTKNAVESFDNYDSVLSLAKTIKEDVGNVPEKLILSCIRSYYKEQEVIVPRQSRPYAPRGSVGSKITAAVLDYVFNTPSSDIDRQGLYDAIVDQSKTPEAAFNKTNAIFPLVFGIANKLDSEDAIEKIKELPPLAKAE